MKMKRKVDPHAAHVTMESITGEGFLRRELALALRSEVGNRGRRMDLVLGLSDGKEDEDEESESGDEGFPRQQDGSAKNEDSSSLTRGGSIRKVKAVSHALKAAEEMAKKEASRVKDEALQRLEADITSHKELKSVAKRRATSTASEQKPFLVNIEDLNVKSMSKENSIPTFNSSRGVIPTKYTSASDKGGAPLSGKARAKANHNKFMAKYGLQKYVSLFKPV